MLLEEEGKEKIIDEDEKEEEGEQVDGAAVAYPGEHPFKIAI